MRKGLIRIKIWLFHCYARDVNRAYRKGIITREVWVVEIAFVYRKIAEWTIRLRGYKC